MFTLRIVRGLCAAFDTIALTAIAAAISKQKLKSRRDAAAFSVCSSSSSHTPISSSPFTSAPSNESPTQRSQSHCEDHDSLKSQIDWKTNSEPALIKLKNERDPQKLFRLFRDNAHNTVVVENRFAFEDTVSRLAGARQFDLIEQLLEHQMTLPQGRREGFVVRIIMLYGKAGMPDQALRTFYKMHLFGCRRSVKSFNASVKVLTMCRRFGDIQKLLNDVDSKFGISLDLVSYNLIVSSMCTMGRPERAYLLMEEMRKAGIEPDVVTYTTLISAFYKHDHHEIGNGLWNLMVRRGCSPNLATLNARIQFLINKCRVWQASSLMRKMGLFGIEPDELTYNLILKGFFLVGNIGMAKSVFFSMQRKKCKPNGKIYQTMVHYLCKEGDFNLAFKFCRDSMKMNWFPSTDTICQLLEGLTIISNDRNIKELMKLIKGRIPSYSAQELEAFRFKLTSQTLTNDM